MAIHGALSDLHGRKAAGLSPRKGRKAEYNADSYSIDSPDFTILLQYHQGQLSLKDAASEFSQYAGLKFDHRTFKRIYADVLPRLQSIVGLINTYK